jgi:hypothetical protein
MMNAIRLIAIILMATLGLIIESGKAAAESRDEFRTYVSANGGCLIVMDKFRAQFSINEAFLGKPALKWTDNDIETAIQVMQDCNPAVGGKEQWIGQKAWWEGNVKLFERKLRDTITTARNLDTQETAKKQALIQLSRQNATRDKEAAEEAYHAVELERSKLEQVTKAREEAQRARRDAEQKLAAIRREITGQEQERDRELAQKQEIERQADLGQLGYQTVTVDGFALDGKVLAAKSAKIALSGFYFREGNLDLLYADKRAGIMARERMSQPSNVALLIDDASREFRRHLLTCQSNPATKFQGCPFTILGHATICTLTSAFGVTREQPCVAVEDER